MRFAVLLTAASEEAGLVETIIVVGVAVVECATAVLAAVLAAELAEVGLLLIATLFCAEEDEAW